MCEEDLIRTGAEIGFCSSNASSGVVMSLEVDADRCCENLSWDGCG